MLDLVSFCDYTGTFAFAISGIRLASAKKFDWFGAYVVGLATAVGGGTIRDLLLNQTPFWMLTPSYLVISFLALLFVVVFRKAVIRINNTVFIFDAIGLGLFCLVGIDKALSLGYPWWIGIVMGTITGSFGGLMRDIFIQELPLVFRKDIYALACVFGGVVYTLLLHSGTPPQIAQIACAVSVIVCRIVAVRFNLSLPALKGEGNNEKEY